MGDTGAPRLYPLIVTPLLVLVSVLGFLATGPGTVGFFNDRVYKNAALFTTAAPAQVITFVWVFCVVVRIWRRTPKLRETAVLPILRTLHNGQLEKVAMVSAATFVATMALYLGIFWRPGVGADDIASTAPFADVVGQLLMLVLPLLVFLLPCFPAWQARKAFLVTLGQCLGCLVGYPIFSHGRVEFRHVFVTDVLTSAAALLWELSYSICHFGHHTWNTTIFHQNATVKQDVCAGNGSETALLIQPAMYFIPYYLRLVQCLAMFVYHKRRRATGWMLYVCLTRAAQGDVLHAPLPLL